MKLASCGSPFKYQFNILYVILQHSCIVRVQVSYSVLQNSAYLNRQECKEFVSQ